MLGSTEYAVAVLGVKLIVVLGHSNCGAASSAIAVANGTKSFPPDKYGAIGAVVGLVVRTVKSIPKKQRTLGRCTVKNARVEANKLASQGPIIKQAVDQRKLRVVAGVYDIGSGRVELV